MLWAYLHAFCLSVYLYLYIGLHLSFVCIPSCSMVVVPFIARIYSSRSSSRSIDALQYPVKRGRIVERPSWDQSVNQFLIVNTERVSPSDVVSEGLEGVGSHGCCGPSYAAVFDPTVTRDNRRVGMESLWELAVNGPSKDVQGTDEHS